MPAPPLCHVCQPLCPHTLSVPCFQSDHSYHVAWWHWEGYRWHTSVGCLTCPGWKAGAPAWVVQASSSPAGLMRVLGLLLGVLLLPLTRGTSSSHLHPQDNSRGWRPTQRNQWTSTSAPTRGLNCVVAKANQQPSTRRWISQLP